ncbi:MAG: hypothetical protein A2426_00040 [Candidatus Lambdaproteobacteria bacterium RIFOXYC1_FULL_56_13]|nr:MAG: hypothetical protein A2426_00040 [Candidatus Lambdaproteobacteria bacterium RIFOXYC1_FULL_56_13]
MAGPCGGQGPGAKVAAGLGVKLDHLEAQVRALDHLEVGVAPLQKGERWMAFLLRRTVALEQRVLELEKAKAPEAQTPVPVRGPLKLRLEQLELRIKALTP